MSRTELFHQELRIMWLGLKKGIKNISERKLRAVWPFVRSNFLLTGEA